MENEENFYLISWKEGFFKLKKKKRVQHYKKESQSVSRFCNWTFVLMHKIYNLN